MVVLLADTRYNRPLIREHGPGLFVDFPISGSAMAAALAEGRDPGWSGIVLA